VIAVVTTLVGLVTAQAVDPQSLVGEWAGTWNSQSAEPANMSGAYSLTIKKVEDAKVFARLHSVSPGRNVDADVVL
jgi:hypothetical protein